MIRYVFVDSGESTLIPMLKCKEKNLNNR